MLIKHTHPKSGVFVSGMRLVEGAVLSAEDRYDSTSGTWEPCPAPGAVLKDTPTIWIRPRRLTPDEQGLLFCLASRPKGCFDCIAKRPSDPRQFLIVPGPNYDWDTRIKISQVIHPECIQPLRDVGFLGKHPCGRGDEVEFYILTDAGRAAAEQLFA